MILLHRQPSSDEINTKHVLGQYATSEKSFAELFVVSHFSYSFLGIDLSFFVLGSVMIGF